MSIHCSDDEWAALENIGAVPRMITVGIELVERVAAILAPALRNQKVQSCLHIIDEINNEDRLLFGDHRILETRQALICPVHTERLICNMCVAKHIEHKHPSWGEKEKCFVCKEPWREDFHGVTAQIQLNRQVPFFDDNRATGQWYTYMGDLWTLPMVWLCPRHKALQPDPIRMVWPTVADDATPESITRA